MVLFNSSVTNPATFNGLTFKDQYLSLSTQVCVGLQTNRHLLSVTLTHSLSHSHSLVIQLPANANIYGLGERVSE